MENTSGCDALFPGLSTRVRISCHSCQRTLRENASYTVRTARALSTKWVGVSEHSSCSVGGGMSVGGKFREWEVAGEKERERSRGNSVYCYYRVSPLRTGVRVHDAQNLPSRRARGRAESWTSPLHFASLKKNNLRAEKDTWFFYMLPEPKAICTIGMIVVTGQHDRSYYPLWWSEMARIVRR